MGPDSDKKKGDGLLNAKVLQIKQLYMRSQPNYNNITKIVNGIRDASDLTHEQFELKDLLDKQLNDIVKLYGIIWNMIILKRDQNKMKRTLNELMLDIYGSHIQSNNLDQSKNSCDLVAGGVVIVIAINSYKELGIRIRDLTTAVTDNDFEQIVFPYIPFPIKNYNAAFPQKHFEQYRNSVNEALSVGNTPFAIILNLELFANTPWFPNTWINIVAYTVGNLMDADDLNAYKKEVFEESTKDILHLVSKNGPNDKLLKHASTDKELINYLALESPSCLICQTTEKLQKCTKCKMAFYCSREHQLNHWPTHKLHCKKLLDIQNNNIV